MPRLNHDGITKIHRDDKTEIPRRLLLGLHFQAHELIPTSISCLGCMPQSGKHHYQEFLVIFNRILGIFNNSDSYLLLLVLFILKCAFSIEKHMKEDLRIIFCSGF